MKRVGKAAEEMIRDRNREEGGPGSASIHEVFLVNYMFKSSTSHLDTYNLCHLFYIFLDQ